MISSNLKWWSVAATVLLCCVPSAFAGSSLTMTGAGSNVMNGVYVGPYYASVNGTPTTVICDDFKDDSVIGHTWNITSNNFSTLGSALWGSQTTAYEQAAWLTVQMLSLNGNPANNTQVGYLSFAIWSIFDKAALNGLNSTQLAGVNNWLNKIPSGLTPSQFANFVILTPQGCTPGSCPGQEFLEVIMPEGGPVTAYLLLAGMSCLGAVWYRGRRKMESVNSRIA
jgi:hypothetical protein